MNVRVELRLVYGRKVDLSNFSKKTSGAFDKPKKREFIYCSIRFLPNTSNIFSATRDH